MKQLDLSLAPADFFVWRYPQDNFIAHHSLTLPADLEAVVIRNGEISDPYRAGDTLTVGARGGFFDRKAPKREEVYLCCKEMLCSLGWGLGGMPCVKETGEGVFGASGRMRLCVTNARLVVRRLMMGLDTLDEKTLGKRIEPLIVENVRPALIDALTQLGAREAGSRLDILAAQTGSIIRPFLSELGLGLETWTVESLICR